MDLIARVSDIICCDGFDVAKESFYRSLFLKLREQSDAAQCIAIPAVIYCLGISCPGFRWESLLHRHSFITIYPLVLLIKWQGSHKAAERGRSFISELNQTSLCLSACLSAYLSACTSVHFLACVSFFQDVCLHVCLSHLSVCLPCLLAHLSISPCLSSSLTASIYLPLSPPRPRLSLCNLTWPLSLVFFRAWLVGWPTFGLIRLTYRRAAGTHTHKHECTGGSFNISLALRPGSYHEPSTHQHHRPVSV